MGTLDDHIKETNMNLYSSSSSTNAKLNYSGLATWILSLHHHASLLSFLCRTACGCSKSRALCSSRSHTEQFASFHEEVGEGDWEEKLRKVFRWFSIFFLLCFLSQVNNFWGFYPAYSLCSLNIYLPNFLSSRIIKPSASGRPTSGHQKFFVIL